MSVVKAQGSFTWAASVTAGNTLTAVDLSGSGFAAGQPLKVIIFMMNAQTSAVDAVASADIKMCIGVATGTAARGVGAFQSDDGAAAAAADCVLRTDCAVCALSTAGADAGRLDVGTFGDDDFQMIVDVAAASDRLVHWMAIGGSDFDVASVGTFTFTDDTATTQDVTVTGFEASPATADQCVVVMSASITLDSVASDGALSLGVAAGATPTNYLMATTANDTEDPTDTLSYCLAGEVSASLSIASAPGSRSSISAWLANGFRFNRIEAEAANRSYIYLAMKGPLFAVFDFTIPTDTTPFSETGFGFQPEAAIFASSGRTASTANAATAGLECSVGFAATVAGQTCLSHYDQNAAATTDCDHAVQYGSVVAVWTPTTGGTLDAVVDLDSFDADGLTLHASNAAGAADKFCWGLAIGGNVVAYTVTADQGSYAYTGQTVGGIRARLATAAQGAYTYTGQTTGAVRGKLATADQGAYAYTGQTVGVTTARSSVAAQGSYAYTGQTVGTSWARAVTADTGFYSLTGQDVAGLRGRNAPADQGSYLLTGQDASLSIGRTGIAETGFYALTGFVPFVVHDEPQNWIIPEFPDRRRALALELLRRRQHLTS